MTDISTYRPVWLIAIEANNPVRPPTSYAHFLRQAARSAKSSLGGLDLAPNNWRFNYCSRFESFSTSYAISAKYIWSF